MSWDAYLTDDQGHAERQWNYTHNCNGMIEAALGLEPGETRQPFWAALGATGMGNGSWWDVLNGKSGPDGAALLQRIIRALEADPERFLAMNPPNGWGDYDSLVKVLTDMRNAVPEWPTTWEVHG